MLEEKRKRIGACEYQVRQLTVPVGRRLLVRLFKILGPAIGAAVGGLPEDKGDDISIGALNTRAIGDAITLLADTITEDELENLCEILADATEYSPEPDRWLPLKKDSEMHWAGRYFDMFKWIAFALEVNYADFLGAQGSLGGFVSAVRKPGQSPSKSPKASTGKSIGSPQAHDTAPA